jgi:hypothetical protein
MANFRATKNAAWQSASESAVSQTFGFARRFAAPVGYTIYGLLWFHILFRS